jgi:hypothetical protein
VSLADLAQADVDSTAAPGAWQSADVGEMKLPGSAKIGETISITASGWGLMGSKDSFHFVYQPLKGDGQIIARAQNLPAANSELAGGVMARSTTGPDSAYAATVIYRDGEVRPKARPAREKALGAAGEPRPWLRVTRRGDLFNMYSSADGEAWHLIDERELELPAEVLWGMAAWTPGNMVQGNAIFEHCRLIPGRPYATVAIGSPFPSRGVVLADSTLIAADAMQLEGDKIQLTRGEVTESVPLDSVAWIVLNPVGPEIAMQMGEKKGVVLTKGDQLEGELTALTKDAVTMTTVLFGPNEYKVDSEVMAVTLRPRRMAEAPWLLRTHDGSVWLGDNLAIDGTNIVIEGTALGRRVVPVSDVVGISRQAPK